MPHALFVHSWLSKNKMDLIGRRVKEGTLGSSITDSMKPGNHHPYSTGEIERTRKFHLKETVIALTIASVVNAGILLIATPLFPNTNITTTDFVHGIELLFGPAIAIIFILTLLASGLSSSALGTLAGQVIMEGLIGKHWNVWARRVVTRFVNVFPTTIAVVIGLDPLHLLIYSQVILSLMIPLPMIPIVYYTSKRKFMGEFVNKHVTTIVALVAVALILAFNSYLILTSFTGS